MAGKAVDDFSPAGMEVERRLERPSSSSSLEEDTRATQTTPQSLHVGGASQC